MAPVQRVRMHVSGVIRASTAAKAYNVQRIWLVRVLVAAISHTLFRCALCWILYSGCPAVVVLMGPASSLWVLVWLFVIQGKYYLFRRRKQTQSLGAVGTLRLWMPNQTRRCSTSRPGP